jgi:hypothetical protein
MSAVVTKESSKLAHARTLVTVHARCQVRHTDYTGGKIFVSFLSPANKNAAIIPQMQASAASLSNPFSNHTTIRVFPVRAMKAYGGSGGVAPLIINIGARLRCGQPHAPAALTLGKQPSVLN